MGLVFKQRNEVFESLKTALTSALILGFPREEGQLYLDRDSSKAGPWTVLSQIQDGEDQVIMYATKMLEGSKQHNAQPRASGHSTSFEAFQVLLVWEKNHRLNGQQRGELAAPK